MELLQREFIFLPAAVARENTSAHVLYDIW